jgi:4-hydroxybenzoate polyprenyltransferase
MALEDALVIGVLGAVAGFFYIGLYAKEEQRKYYLGLGFLCMFILSQILIELVDGAGYLTNQASVRLVLDQFWYLSLVVFGFYIYFAFLGGLLLRVASAVGLWKADAGKAEMDLG